MLEFYEMQIIVAKLLGVEIHILKRLLENMQLRIVQIWIEAQVCSLVKMHLSVKVKLEFIFSD